MRALLIKVSLGLALMGTGVAGSQQPMLPAQTTNGPCSPIYNGSGNTTNCDVKPPLKLTYEAHPVASDNKQFEYMVQVVISTNTDLQPVSLAVVCSAEVAQISVTGIHFEMVYGIDDTRKNIAFFRFSGPPINPSSPLVVIIYSHKPFGVTDVVPANIPNPFAPKPPQ